MTDAPDITVLVVDDEPCVRGVLQVGLARQGMRVLAAADGPTAVRLYQESDARVDVVLSDVRMPGMDGPQTVDALRALDPGVRAVFMSGNTGGYSAADLTRRGAVLLNKPFTDLSALAAVLRQVASTPAA